MVCPVAKKQARHDSPTDYPFEALYRPWSWMLSSFSNVFLFAALLIVLYILYRKKKGKGKRDVTYRSVETKKADVLESKGKTTALVTGGSGSLGREIVRCLIEDGSYRVYSLDLTIPDSDDRNPDVYSYIQADITDIDNLKLALRGIEVVFHSAGIVPKFVGHTKKDFLNVNGTGTECVVSASKACGVERLVYTSSLAVVLSNDPNQVIENLTESTPYPKQSRDSYGASKTIGEKCVLAANGKDGLLTCALRPHGIVDKEWMKAVDVRYFGDGLSKSQFIPVDTAAKVHVLAEKKLKSDGESSVIAGKAYFLCLEESFSHLELADCIASVRGVDEKPTSVPSWVVKFLIYLSTFIYKVFGKAVIHPGLRIDIIPYLLKTHTITSALGRKEIGWEDKRMWRDVVHDLNQEVSKEKEAKKEQ